MPADPFAVDAVSLQTPPAGRVEVQRRRVTKDGRVKLKLALMGVVVDKCGICLTQFKDAEVACLGTHCQHAYVFLVPSSCMAQDVEWLTHRDRFHEYCLKRWIATSRTCPMCRASI